MTEPGAQNNVPDSFLAQLALRQPGSRQWSRLPSTALCGIRHWLRGFNGSRTSTPLLHVHPDWRGVGRDLIRRVRPRISRPTPFVDCLRCIYGFSYLQSIELPPLSESHVFFDQLGPFEQLQTLILRRLNLKEGRTSLTPLPNLKELSIEDSILNSVLLYSISGLNRLRHLRLKNVRPVNGLLPEYLSVLPDELERLKIVDSPQLTNGSLNALTTMTRLSDLALGVTSLNTDQIHCLAMMHANMNLEIYGRHNMEIYHPLAANVRIKSLKFSGFGVQFLPGYLAHMELEVLALTGGRIWDDRDPNVFVSPSLTDLSISFENGDRTTLARMVQNPEGLRALAFAIPAVIPDIDLSPFVNLESLKLTGIRDFDGDAFEKIAMLTLLKSLQITGCMNISGADIQHLSQLNNLTSLVFCNSVPTRNACEQLAQLPQLKHLGFIYCPSLRPEYLPELHHVTKMEFGRCPIVEQNLEMLLAREDIQSLDCLGFKFMNDNDHIAVVFAESGILERHVDIDMDIRLPIL